MAIDNKYGQISIPGVPDDEPVFVIRAQDETAIDTLGDYQDNAERAGASQQFVDGVADVIAGFRVWQDANHERVHTPD